MPTPSTEPVATESPTQKLSRRADEVLLKLLDTIEKQIDEGGPDYLGMYEALCRAEAARTGL